MENSTLLDAEPVADFVKKRNSAAYKRRKRLEKFNCPSCDKKFSFSSNLYRHLKNIHKKTEMCNVEGCDFRCANKQKMTVHVELEHSQLSSEKQELQFASLEEFYAWKLREEVQNFVCFTKRRGDIEMLASTHQHYTCFLTKRIAATKGKVTKSCLFCPARMLLKQSKKNGSVRVTYFKTHTHKLTYSGNQRLPIPECLRHQIKVGLRAGLNVDQIYEQLQREHQSQLAVSIAMYKRLQKVDKAQISIIEKAMIKKGTLQPQFNDRQSDKAAVKVIETTPCGVEIIINDGEVRVDMELPEKFSKDLLMHINSLDVPPDLYDLKTGASEQGAPQDTGDEVGEQVYGMPSDIGIMDNFEKTSTASTVGGCAEQGEECSKAEDMCRQLLMLLQSGQVESKALPAIEGTMQKVLGRVKLVLFDPEEMSTR